jgi:hypothetical protein
MFGLRYSYYFEHNFILGFYLRIVLLLLDLPHSPGGLYGVEILSPNRFWKTIILWVILCH